MRKSEATNKHVQQGRVNISGNGNAVGDGNIVGDNNSVIHNDNRTFNQIRQSRQSSTGEPSSKETPQPIAVAFIAIVAVAFATWKFVAYSQAANSIVQWTAVALGALQLLALMFGVRRDADMAWKLGRLMMLIAAGAIVAGASKGGGVLESGTVAFAGRARDWMQFACGLTLYGRQIAVLQLIAICVLSVFALLSLAWNTAYVYGLVFAVQTEWRVLDRFIGISTVRSASFAVLLALAAVLSQTSFAFDFWSETIFTPQHDPFGSRGLFSCGRR